MDSGITRLFAPATNGHRAVVIASDASYSDGKTIFNTQQLEINEVVEIYRVCTLNTTHKIITLRIIAFFGFMITAELKGRRK